MILIYPIARRCSTSINVNDRVLPYVIISEGLYFLNGFLKPFVLVTRMVRYEIQ